MRCFSALLISSDWIQWVMDYFNIFTKEIKGGCYRHYFSFMYETSQNFNFNVLSNISEPVFQSKKIIASSILIIL